MQLVIPEKPSVAMGIAAVLKVDKRQDGYIEGKKNHLNSKAYI